MLLFKCEYLNFAEKMVSPIDDLSSHILDFIKFDILPLPHSLNGTPGLDIQPFYGYNIFRALLTYGAVLEGIKRSIAFYSLQQLHGRG